MLFEFFSSFSLVRMPDPSDSIRYMSDDEDNGQHKEKYGVPGTAVPFAFSRRFQKQKLA